VQLDDTITSTAERLMKKAKEKEKQEELKIEAAEEWKKLVNSIAASENGKTFLKFMVKASGVFNIDSQLNPAKLVEDRGRKEFYLKFIRPYLETSIRSEIE